MANEPENMWGETTMRDRNPSFGRRKGQFSGDIEPVRRRTTFIMAFTLVVIAALVAADYAVKQIRQPAGDVMPDAATGAAYLEANPGNLYVKAVVDGRFAEVFERTAWMQARAGLLHDEYGHSEGDVATDEFFEEMRTEFEAVEDDLVMLTEDGINDRLLFGRAVGFDLLEKSEQVTWSELRHGEPLTEYRYRLSYPKGTLTPTVMTGQKVKTMEVSLLLTGKGKVVKAAVEGNAVIHPETIRFY